VRKTLLTLLVSAALVAGCQSNKEPAITELSPNNLRAVWTRTLDLKDAAPREIYARDNMLFVYTTQNMVYQMDRKSGDVGFIIRAASPGAQAKPPVLHEGSVIIPTDQTLDYYNTKGYRTASIKLKDPIRSGIATDKYGTYVGIDSGSGGARIASIDASSPNSPYRWQFLTKGVVVSTPAIYEGVLFSASDDGNVYAVDSDRNEAWTALKGVFKTDGPVHGDVTAEKSGVYVASADSKLYCLNPRDGKILWQYYSGFPLFDSPAVTATTVYINVRDHGVAAIDKGNGEYERHARWVVPDTTRFLAEDDQYAFLLGKNNAIVAVDKKTGEVKFTSKRTDLVVFAVNTTDGVIYAATAKGKVIAAVAVKRHGEVGELVWAEPADMAAYN